MTDMPGYSEMFQKLVEAMPLEKRLAGLAPEERLAGLDRDHQTLALPVKVLRVLPETYLGSLAPAIQEEIRRRLRAGGH